jgi:hypothetical protein
MGVMSGTLDLLQRAYLGAGARDGVLSFRPRLTDRLDGLAFSMVFQGTTLRISVADGALSVEVQSEGFSHPVRVALGDETRELGAGQSWSVPLDAYGRAAHDDRAMATSGAPRDDGDGAHDNDGASNGRPEA